MRLGFDRQIWEKFGQATSAQNLSWRKEFLREFAETDPGRDRPLGALPVIVLSGNPPASEAERESRDGAGLVLTF